MRKFSVSVAALASGLVLSACSGGGGGGGVGSPGGSAPGTGTAPAPNGSLLALNSSETFTNDGATATANFAGPNALPTLAVAATPISVAYDASARSYTITSGSRSQTFLPSDRDATTSTAQLSMFKRVSGNKTDTLALTAVGTSGAFTYQYVGGGYWQQIEENAGAVNGTFDAFTYGIRTKDSAMPRTGLGSYAIDLIGVETGAMPQLWALAGSGTMDVDFAGGQLLFSGTGVRASVLPQSFAVKNNFTFSGNAGITSGTAAFTGEMRIELGTPGQLTGRFFGPAADEVGASFAIGTEGGGGFTRDVGTITGRKQAGTVDGAFTPLANISSAKMFTLPAPGSMIAATVQNSRGAQPGQVVSTNIAPNAAWTSLGFDPAAKSYTFDGRTFAAANVVAAESSEGVKTYRQVDGDKTATLRIYTPNGTNGSIALTYSGFADYMAVQQPATGTTDSMARLWSVYGVETQSSNVPRTGTATYVGQIYGAAVRNGFAAYDMRGTASISVNFVSRMIGGELRPLFTPVGGGTSLDFGGLQIMASIGFAPTANTFYGSATPMISGGSNTTVTLTGRFFGPTAQEAGLNFGGTWSPNAANPNDNLFLQGAAIGKRQ
ncbi:hypothetical protein SAMN03159338_1193 [Sphingomonas sp. NFR04]|uniref:transferrin-binding protein-like solute binding protein n=1 Tax=Sphingomonas sp. NFR04 TaxID=1566283 RepID=UPI0008F41C2F|nr:transferrin-binding protein-like solute binding protein [Sphingomonas sp. NFR04]SFJ24990.1 hypothetical protein SAMN03159338_1193 [Sphingomonas sp. NFR04]